MLKVPSCGLLGTRKTQSCTLDFGIQTRDCSGSDGGHVSVTQDIQALIDPVELRIQLRFISAYQRSQCKQNIPRRNHCDALSHKSWTGGEARLRRVRCECRIAEVIVWCVTQGTLADVLGADVVHHACECDASDVRL